MEDRTFNDTSSASSSFHSDQQNDEPPLSLNLACKQLESDIFSAENFNFQIASLTTGFMHIDNLIGGIKPGDLTVISSTSNDLLKDFAINIALHVAEQGVPVDIFSHNAEQNDYAQRMLNSKCSIADMQSIEKADAAQLREIMTYTERLSTLPINIQTDEDALLDLVRITAQQRSDNATRIRKGLLIVEDPAALRREHPSTPAISSKDVAEKLKACAVHFGIPIVILQKIEICMSESQTLSFENDGDRGTTGSCDEDVAISIEFASQMKEDDSWAPVRTIVRKSKTRQTQEATIVYVGIKNKLLNFFQDDGQKIERPNLPKLLCMETGMIDINDFLRQAEKATQLVTRAFEGVDDAKISANLYLKVWVDSGIEQSLLDELNAKCTLAGIDHFKHG